MEIEREIRGLDSAEAARRLTQSGPNALPEVEPPPLWKRFLRQFQNPLTYILLFALVFDVGLWVYEAARGVPIEALAIAAVLLLNAGLGAFQEHRSERALARLKAMAAPQAWVVRDGELVHIPSRDIVAGDVVRIEAGERVPADGTVVEARGILVDESILTGESVPVDKAIEAEAFSGTLVVRGKGLLLVNRTGPASSMGKLATMIGQMETSKTPLERRLGVLGDQVAKVVGGLALLLAIAGVVVEGIDKLHEVVLFAVALAVAAVPEGMPAVVTLTLALGVERMARRRAIVRRLSAVEALGSVTAIATDKTGTLTENRMFVKALHARQSNEALLAMVLANDADIDAAAGDPLELALMEHARAQGVDCAAVRHAHPRLASRPFDSDWKFMRVTVDSAGRRVSYLKGAPEVMIERSTLTAAERIEWTERAEAGAREGYRVLGLARAQQESEIDLELLGLVSLWDPPRPEVPAAIASAQAAGVRVLMITGDHPATAGAVAEAVGLRSPRVITGTDIEAMSADELRSAVRTCNVFARVSPEHKLRLVEALQAERHIVAMTGDGVNDAPALKRSDVGIAMGQRGSDVAREVADLVLMDDNFASIVGAIEEGRGIYDNIQKFIRFTFSTNVALVMVVVLGAAGSYMLGLREDSGMLLLPLTALQLLWINFLGDGPPALAIALDRNPGVMQRPPRPPESALLDEASTRFILATGISKGAIGVLMLVMLPMWGLGFVAARTWMFLYASISKLVSAYPSRRLERQAARNATLHVSIVLGIALQLAAVLVPSLREVLGLEPLDVASMAIMVAAVAVTWLFAEITNVFIRRAMPVRPPAEAVV